MLGSFIGAFLKLQDVLAETCCAQLIKDSLSWQVFQSIPACIDLLGGPYVETYDHVVKAFRPKTMLRGSQT